MLNFKSKPKQDSALSEFMRNASSREKKRAFKEIIEESIKDQQKIIDLADRMVAEKNT